jgi:transcriptional regulator with XRE-family HTH domain
MYTRYAEIRDKAGLNDRQVAERTGIPQSTIYDWKQRAAKDANAGISAIYLAKIAKVIGCDISDLIDE